MTIGFKLLVFTNINSNIIGFIQASIDFLVCNVAVNLVIREFHESPSRMAVVTEMESAKDKDQLSPSLISN